MAEGLGKHITYTSNLSDSSINVLFSCKLYYIFCIFYLLLVSFRLITFLIHCLFIDPTWASVNRGVLICHECCSVHRSLGRHISQVKHLKKAQWNPSRLTVSFLKVCFLVCLFLSVFMHSPDIILLNLVHH